MGYKVRTLLLAGFALVVGIFAAATVTAGASLARVAELQDRLRRLDDAKHEGHLARAAIQEEYIHQAHTIIEGDRSHLHHYEPARRAAEERVSALALACASAGLPGGTEDIRRTVAEMHRYFEAEVLPALGDRKAALEHSRGLERLTEQAKVQTLTLNRELGRESAEAERQLRRVLEGTRTRTLAMLSAAAISALAVGLHLVRRIGRPVSRLHDAIRDLGTGVKTVRVEAGSQAPRELQELALRFNEMAAALETMRTRVEAQARVAALGELAAGVAHELNNPLGVITGYLKTARREIPEGPAARDLVIVADEVEQCRRIVAGLLDLARPRPLERRPLDLAALAREAAERAARAGEGPRAAVGVNPPGPAVVSADETALRQILGNLLLNAFEAAGPQGRVEVSVATGDGTVTLAVGDSGPGFAPEIACDLFKPFRTTKPNGTGLGLAVCDLLVRAHGGRMEAGRSPLGGAEVRVTLPV